MRHEHACGPGSQDFPQRQISTKRNRDPKAAVTSARIQPGKLRMAAAHEEHRLCEA